MGMEKVLTLILGIGSISFLLKSLTTLLPRGEQTEPEFIKVFTVNGPFPVTKYVSRKTGLEVIHEQMEGSLVNCYIALATRAEDDDGLPHTLEHLVFHGSEEYPYKGTLNMIVNKCFGSGTNAMTQADYTLYFFKTAASEGVYTILPIYLDHIFFPILSEASFKTEVHHVTGQGTDAGVVYSETQSKSTDSSRKAHLELSRVLFPPDSGYHYEVGGIPKNLRESTNMDKIKLFHKKYYHPRNTQIIVTGIIEPEVLFKSLEPVVKKLVSRAVDVSNWTKPWIQDISEIASPQERTIYFPSVREDLSLVVIGFRGPSAASEFEELAVLRFLLKYLLLDTDAPLKKMFVTDENPLAVTVFDRISLYRRTVVAFEFEGVKTERKEEVPKRLRAALESQLINFNLTVMTDIIEKIVSTWKNKENSYDYNIGGVAIKDFLFGNGQQDMFEKRLNPFPDIGKLLNETRDFWTNFLQERILSQKWITIYSVPSHQCLQEFVADEENRVKERNETLGVSGLEKLDEELKEAIRENSEIPDLILEQVQMPSIESIHYHQINRMMTPDWASDFKAKLLVDDINSDFVHIRVLLDTTALAAEYRDYLTLFRYYILQAPILDDEMKLVPAMEVNSAKNRDLLIYYTTHGISEIGSSHYKDYSHLLTLGAKMEVDKVKQGIDWIWKMLWKTQWDDNVFKMVVNRMIGSDARAMLIGEYICRQMLREIIYKSDSNIIAANSVRQQSFLTELVACLPNCTENITLAFDAIQNVITDPNNMVVHLATNITRLKAKLAAAAPPSDIASLFNQTFPFDENATKSNRLANEPDAVWMLPEEEIRNKTGDFILGLPGGDSSHLSVAAPGPYLDSHPDLPALLSTIQYFIQMGGPFWNRIRGGGYAYSFTCYVSPTEGLVYFELYRCSDVVGAYRGAKEAVEEHVDDETVWSEEKLKSAKSSLIYKNVAAGKSPMELAKVSLQSYYKNTSEIFTRELVSLISRVQLADVVLMTEKYLMPVFNDSYACIITCPLHKRELIVDGFNRLGKILHVIPS